MSKMSQISPCIKARIAGALYLLNILTILSTVFLFRGISVAGDPAATATNVLAHEAGFRLAFASELVSTACSVAVAALFYELFKPVNSSISLTASLFRIVACAIAAVGYLFQLAPFQVMSGASYLSAIKPEELSAFAGVFYTFSAQASHISIVFFGFHFVLLGYLILRSAFLPRILGVFVALAGLGGLTYLVPPLAAHLFPFFVAAGLLGEVSLSLWLLIKGVDAQRWGEQATMR